MSTDPIREALSDEQIAAFWTECSRRPYVKGSIAEKFAHKICAALAPVAQSGPPNASLVEALGIRYRQIIALKAEIRELRAALARPVDQGATVPKSISLHDDLMQAKAVMEGREPLMLRAAPTHVPKNSGGDEAKQNRVTAERGADSIKVRYAGYTETVIVWPHDAARPSGCPKTPGPITKVWVEESS